MMLPKCKRRLQVQAHAASRAVVAENAITATITTVAKNATVGVAERWRAVAQRSADAISTMKLLTQKKGKRRGDAS